MPHRALLEWGALYLRGPRKSLIFGVSYCSLAGDNISVLPLGAPKELRSNGERGIGSRPNCSVAAGHFAFPADNIGAPRELRSNGESGGLRRPLIKWSGKQPCGRSAERDLAHTLPAASFPQRSRNRFANLEIAPARSPFAFKAVLFRYNVPKEMVP